MASAPFSVIRSSGFPTCADLALGTVQIGMRYGIANITGQPDLRASGEIVRCMLDHGVRFFDTAQAYGASETILGSILRNSNAPSDVRTITKLRPECFADGRSILVGLGESARRLQIDKIWGVLLHSEDQLDEWENSLSSVLETARRTGLVSHLGVSVYTPERALQALEMRGIDLVQVPANIFDRRMARSGFFERANARGKTVFVRSVYLQGLALLSLGSLEQRVPHASKAVDVLRGFCDENNISVQQFAMDYVRSMAPGAKLVIGVETVEQAHENCRIFENPSTSAAICEAWDRAWPMDFIEMIDPRRWPPIR